MFQFLLLTLFLWLLDKIQNHISVHGLESITVSHFRGVVVYPGDLKISVSETFLGSNPRIGCIIKRSKLLSKQDHLYGSVKYLKNLNNLESLCSDIYLETGVWFLVFIQGVPTHYFLIFPSHVVVFSFLTQKTVVFWRVKRGTLYFLRYSSKHFSLKRLDFRFSVWSLSI